MALLDVEKTANDTDGTIEGVGSETVPYWRYILDQPLITPSVRDWPYPGSGTAADPYRLAYVAGDRRDAMAMSHGRRAVITALMAVLTLAASFMSSSYAGCLPQIMADLRVSRELATAGISLYVVGFAVGPMLWAPLGEMCGRQIIIFVSFGLFTLFNACGAACRDIAALLVVRFLAGCCSASALTNTGAVIADMYPAAQRGVAMGLFAMAPFMGPVFGPVVGGFLGQAAGWRWVQGLSAVFSGLLWLATAAIVPETFAPYILRLRARALSHATGHVYVSAIDAARSKTASASASAKLYAALVRPWQLLASEPPLVFLTLYMSILYGILYMLFGAFPIVYQEGRGWNQGVGGLAFMGVAVGEIVGILFCIPDSRRYACNLAARGGLIVPEDRLLVALVGSFAVPIGLFWFAWTNGPDIHWSASVIAGAPFGFGIVLMFISIKNYITDAYSIFAASALAGTVIFRSAFGAAFPLFTTYMFHNLGIHWAATLVAFLATACIPIPFVLHRWGHAIRARCRFAAEVEALTNAAHGH